MQCENWENIKSLIEDIIDSGTYKFSKYIKYIDVKKKCKNIEIDKKYDKKYKAYKIMLINDMSDLEIKDSCKKNLLPDYVCINQINEMNKELFIEQFGIKDYNIKTYPNLTIDEVKNELNKIGKYINKPYEPKLDDNNNAVCCLADEKLKKWEYQELYDKLKNYDDKSTHGLNNGLKFNIKYATRIWMGYINDGNIRYILKIAEKTDTKILPLISYDINNKDSEKKHYIIEDSIVKYSIIKQEYENKMENPNNTDIYILPENYYWKSPDGWLFLHKKEKSNVESLKIRKPTTTIETPIVETPIVNLAQNEVEIQSIPLLNQEQTNNSDIIINSDIKLFVDICIKKTDKKRLRLGIVELHNKYKSWCKTNNKIILIKNKFKNELTKLGYKEEATKGIDLNNKLHKRGYNITLLN